MADIKISELTAVSTLNNGDLVEVSQVNELAPSGYTSLKASMADIGKKVNTDIEYTTDLADFTNKTTLGAIKETANLIPKTDNNLPHYTGTPTAGSTAEAIGDLTTLSTTDKSSLVGAVNEVDGAITSPKDITSDYITMASGYTFTSGKVYKQGKHIFGNIVLSGTLQGGNNTDTLGTIKSDYRTADPINGFCGISNGQWFTNNIGYVYIASSGGLQVATTPTGMNYAKIHLDYITA